ncbi:hypothetical protein BEP19_12880 [Ammoniphilus oxalaticus]|uniref:Tryptophan synthase beta chain-like PALP domain-containing protein n=2 Tax=Ammoniphilus oxalaticus TaxID=66863 RepID=A0A419SHH0_9BACL|nr:hypothetical protein BEP19_12880 [Ammoniphilus oxalaticus]
MNYSDGSNHYYIKRDDLLPFSFGGNKVRIAEQYFHDMKNKNCDCIIAYGNSRSNLCRVIANMSKSLKIPCFVISPSDDSGGHIETNNSRIVKALGAKMVYCNKKNISQTVKKVMDDCIQKGLNPYYIYGNIFGKGNEKVAVEAYATAYDEINEFESESGVTFDYIFHASGTGTTQAGLICGSLLYGDNKKIVGISVARNASDNKEIIKHNISEYMNGKVYREKDIYFEDKYVLGGYGNYNNEIINVINEMLSHDGISLDPTYTGKAFWGMTEYLKENSIGGKKILFIHTGGLPLFFDNINLI